MAKVTWTVEGTIKVRERETSERGAWQERPLAGILVQVSGSTVSSSTGWREWGTVRTRSDGSFTLRASKGEGPRWVRVRVRFEDDDLQVNKSLLNVDVLESNWHTIFKPAKKRAGPRVGLGARVFGSGVAHDLDDEEARRQATAWYMCRTLIDRLVDEDPWFAFGGRITVVYPARVVSGVPYANGVTRRAYIHEDRADHWWSGELILHEVMHLWNYDHNTGTSNWADAICWDFNTHGHQENPNIAFHEGFAQYAAEDLLHHIWGWEKRLPFNRRHLHSRGLIDFAMVERSDRGVIGGLHLLTYRGIKYGHHHLRFGTATVAPDGAAFTYDFAKDSAGTGAIAQSTTWSSTPPAHLDLWDVLRAFRAHAASGWSTDWQVGRDDYGLRRFLDRCCDRYASFNPATRDRFVQLLDPSSTVEP